MWRRRFAFLFVFAVLWMFPYGPLFPWSPIKPGFERVTLARADVYYPTGAKLDPAFLKLDSIIDESERFHWLRVHKRITVVDCKEWSTFRRFMPQMRGTGVGAVTLATGDTIYVTPQVANRGFDVGEFLRHEVSHATVNQNQSVLNAVRIADVQWLAEGLAVSYGRQKAYYTREEFLARVRREDVAPFLDPDRRGDVKGIFDMRYAYVVWRNFNEYLMSAKGRERYQRYLRSAMDDPRAWREAFPRHFDGLTFAAAVAEFQNSMRTIVD